MPLMPHEQLTPFDSSVTYESIWYAMIKNNDLVYCSRNPCLRYISKPACPTRGWFLLLNCPPYVVPLQAELIPVDRNKYLTSVAMFSLVRFHDQGEG